MSDAVLVLGSRETEPQQGRREARSLTALEGEGPLTPSPGYFGEAEEVTQEVTIGELSRRMDRFEADTRERFKALDDRNQHKTDRSWMLVGALAAAVLGDIAAVIAAVIH